MREFGSIRCKEYHEIVAYGNLFLSHLLEPSDLSSDPNTYSDGVPKDTLFDRKEILARIAKINFIEKKMEAIRSEDVLENNDH